MSKHTKGPWIASDNGPAFDSYIHALKNKGDAFKFVAMVPLKTNPKETRANAQLIAAAPDLLEAAINVLETYPIPTITGASQYKLFASALTDLRNAIKKARGEK